MVRALSLVNGKLLFENAIAKLFLSLYRRSIPYKVKRIRKKERIKVLFIISELSVWKTETLYLKMLKHPRFDPIIGLTMSVEAPLSKEELRQYLEQKEYNYVELTPYVGPNSVSPDIIFYQKPYIGSYLKNLLYDHCFDSLFCHVGYAFNSLNTDWAIHPELYYACWQIFFENQVSIAERSPLMRNGGKNLVNTGLPMMDDLILPKSHYLDPWTQLGPHKRIIFAPHHTIGDAHLKGIGFSTFLDNAEFMLSLAIKYQDQVQWAFKPHPLLYNNLIRVWGKAKTDAYYEQWSLMPGCQVETGKYEGLFAYSDAMIHDCASFTIEYLYTHKPVLYLTKDSEHCASLTKFAAQAFDLHYKAKTQSEIEHFVLDVIAGKDQMKEARELFYQEQLCPPNHQSACQNIIDAILGEHGYH